MKKVLMMLILLTAICTTVFAQAETELDSLITVGKVKLQNAYANWTESELLQARAYFERLSITYSSSWLINYYIGFADYRLAAYYLSINDKDKAKKLIDDGIDQLKMVTDANPEFADGYNLLSSLYGNKIAVKPILGMTLGPKSGMALGKAIEIDPNNPRNYLIAGISAYFTPKLFGGGMEKAGKNIEKAIICFDSFQVAHPTYPDWGHAEAYAWLGLVKLKSKEYADAENAYSTALKLNPNFGWVEYVLLPDLKQKTSQSVE